MNQKEDADEDAHWAGQGFLVRIGGGERDYGSGKAGVTGEYAT